jgi:hypothetical protein
MEKIMSGEEKEFIKLPEEFNEAIIGVTYEQNAVMYSIERILEVLMIKQKLPMDEAIEHFNFNMGNALGEGMPKYTWTEEYDHLLE